MCDYRTSYGYSATKGSKTGVERKRGKIKTVQIIGRIACDYLCCYTGLSGNNKVINYM